VRPASGLLLISICAFAQEANVSLNLSATGGKMQFRIGEPIPLELDFAAPGAPGLRIWTGACSDTLSATTLDRFAVAPDSGWQAPWAGRCTTMKPDRLMALPPVPSELNPQSGHLREDLNDYVIFVDPGHYRVQVESARLTGAGPVQSNPIEFDILDRDTAADQTRFTAAKATLDAAIPKGGTAADVQDQIAAVRSLRCLQTESAARYLASIYGRGLGADGDIYLALRTSLCRERALGDLQTHLADADLPVTVAYIDAIVELSSDLGKFGPGLPVSSEQDAFRAYYQSALQSAPRKAGEARAVTYFTVFTEAPLPIGFGVQARRGLVASLPQAPAEVWSGVLNGFWDKVADPGTELVPALKEEISKTRTDPNAPNGIARAAVQRLAEVDPGSARGIVLQSLLANLTQLDFGPGLLDRAVPDLDIPYSQELEDALLGLYTHGYGVEARLARYASPRIAKQVLEAYDRSYEQMAGLPNPVCTSPVLAYLFRVDPVAAAQRVARIRQLHHYRESGALWDVCGALPFKEFMSPGLERQLIEDLRSSDRVIQMVAASTLGAAGSAAAKQPLWDALELLANPSSDKAPVRDALVRALLSGPGWLLMLADYDRLERLCGNSSYCSQVHWNRQWFREPYRIQSLEPTGFWILQHAAYSLPDLERQVALFPEGSSFQWVRSSSLSISLAPREEWLRDQVRALVVRHGMKWAPD
jgi:hypothetical protein